MNVIVSPKALVRTFSNGTQDPILGYTITGKARLETLSGYDGPSYDDVSGPSDETKHHAESARIAVDIRFLRGTSWGERVVEMLSDRQRDAAQATLDREAVRAACAVGFYVPSDSKNVERFGAPDHDELECYLKVEDDAADRLIAWLDRCASAPDLLPTITLDGLYFHSDTPMLRWLMKPGPRWEDFLAMRSPGTFESYSMDFRAVLQ